MQDVILEKKRACWEHARHISRSLSSSDKEKLHDVLAKVYKITTSLFFFRKRLNHASRYVIQSFFQRKIIKKILTSYYS